MNEYQYIPVSQDCDFCNKPLMNHLKCAYCRILIHNMSKVSSSKRKKYYCSCGINHTKTSDNEYCQDCIEKGKDSIHRANTFSDFWEE